MSTVGFGFDESTTEGSVSKFIQVTPETAIAAGRFIKEIKFEENEGNPYMEIVVTNALDQTAGRRYYEPKVDGSIIKNDADFKKAITKFNGVAANLARRFLGETYKPEGVKDFTSLCKTIIKDIGNKYVNKELRIKLILNNKNFPTLPTYAPIFEDVTTNPSKLVVNTAFDTVVSTYKRDDAAPDSDLPQEGIVPLADKF
jgi:hypothetical protein